METAAHGRPLTDNSLAVCSQMADAKAEADAKHAAAAAAAVVETAGTADDADVHMDSEGEDQVQAAQPSQQEVSDVPFLRQHERLPACLLMAPPYWTEEDRAAFGQILDTDDYIPSWERHDGGVSDSSNPEERRVASEPGRAPPPPSAQLQPTRSQPALAAWTVLPSVPAAGKRQRAAGGKPLKEPVVAPTAGSVPAGSPAAGSTQKARAKKAVRAAHTQPVAQPSASDAEAAEHSRATHRPRRQAFSATAWKNFFDSDKRQGVQLPYFSSELQPDDVHWHLVCGIPFPPGYPQLSTTSAQAASGTGVRVAADKAATQAWLDRLQTLAPGVQPRLQAELLDAVRSADGPDATLEQHFKGRKSSGVGGYILSLSGMMQVSSSSNTCSLAHLKAVRDDADVGALTTYVTVQGVSGPNGRVYPRTAAMLATILYMVIGGEKLASQQATLVNLQGAEQSLDAATTHEVHEEVRRWKDTEVERQRYATQPAARFFM